MLYTRTHVHAYTHTCARIHTHVHAYTHTHRHTHTHTEFSLLPPWAANGRKVMTSLDSILKSRNITLPTKVCPVKAMVFPVVMYGCESWTIKAELSTEELMLLNCGVGEDS